MILIFYLVLLVFFTPFRNSCFVLCNNDKKHLLICRFQYRYTVTKVSALCLLTPIAACRYLAGFPEFRYQTRNPDCHFGIRPNTKYKNNWFIRPDRCSHPARCGIIANCIWWAPLYQCTNRVLSSYIYSIGTTSWLQYISSECVGIRPETSEHSVNLTAWIRIPTKQLYGNIGLVSNVQSVNIVS